jgi:hypothetical protein
MIISSSRRFIFIHTMKTAGDSVAVALTPSLARNDFLLQNDFQAWRRRVTGGNPREFQMLTKHSPALEVREQLPPEMWESYFKFAFVRHPVSRAMSFYRYISQKAEQRKRLLARNVWYQTPPGRPGDPVHWPAMKVFVATDSFSTFIRHPDIAGVPGMQPQSDFVCDEAGEVIVDFVGRYECLEQDMATVQDSIGLPRQRLDRRNASVGRHSTTSGVSEEDLDYLLEKFQVDFVRFGYDR